MDATTATITCEDLSKLYTRYARDGKLEDTEWTVVQDCLKSTAHYAVRRSAARHKIPSRTLAERTEEVLFELLQKWLKKKMGDRIRNFDAQLQVIAYHACITVLRRIKSPMVAHLESEPPRDEAPEQESGDVFGSVRDRLPPFRFRDFSCARDALLAVRISTKGFPGAEFLRVMVPSGVRALCYNAAVFDINRALGDGRDGHRNS